MNDGIVVPELSLRGEQVGLRSTTPSDRPALVAIRSTPEVRRRWRGEDLEVEFDEELEDDQLHQLTIESIEGRILGLIQFSEEEDPEYRHASLDIYLDPAMHRQGYATDAIRTLVDFLFDQRGHHRLTIDPDADNVAATRCYAKVGFRPVGVMRSYERQADGTWGGWPPDGHAGRRTGLARTEIGRYPLSGIQYLNPLPRVGAPRWCAPDRRRCARSPLDLCRQIVHWLTTHTAEVGWTRRAGRHGPGTPD